MMRQSIGLMVAGAILLFLSFSPSIGAEISHTDLVNLVSGNEDPLITSIDLAFFLATHGYDASPQDAYAIVNLNGTYIKLIPNGNSPGLADIYIQGNNSSQ